MAHDMEGQVAAVVKLMRSVNWNAGGVLLIDNDAAEALVLQLVQTAYSKGRVDAAKQTGESMLRTFDEAIHGQSMTEPK